MGSTSPNVLRGIQLVRDPHKNKDVAFTIKERRTCGLNGLLPPTVRSQEQQVAALMETVQSLDSPLAKYVYLRDVQDNNERLFYAALSTYTEKLMPIVYTPVVGLACQNYSLIYKRPRGLYITINDAGSVASVLANWSQKDVKAIVVTDGERILGLGDLGANGMGIPCGKLALYTALAGVPPQQTLPITIDVGTNNQKLLHDPFYIGLKQKRLRGQAYSDLIDEFMNAVVGRWGKSCLIQFEDFGNENAFHLLEKYENDYCTFNDDIQGTASVVVAGIIAGVRATGQKMNNHVYLFHGAGEAAIGTAHLLVMAMEEEGLTIEEARKRIWMTDSRGLITIDRPAGGITERKAKYAKTFQHVKDLDQIVGLVRPTCLIGLSAQPGAFTSSILRQTTKFAERPLIFALSNPTSLSECTAEEAYINTDGRCIFASGSPFDPVTLNCKTYIPGQGNNSYIFPGVALAIMACGVHKVPNKSFLIAAKALAAQVTKDDIDLGRIYPPLTKIREVSTKVAAKVAEYFYVENLATVEPEPKDKVAFIRSRQYDYRYD